MSGFLKRLLGALGPGRENGSCSDGSGEILPCPEVLERLFEYLDGELDEPTLEQVERHLEICRRCYPRLRFERSFMDALRATRAGQAPSPELRKRVVDVLSREGLEVR